jgi:hypothetical protein
MIGESEVIALVLPDEESGFNGRTSGAQMLIRHADGQMSLQTVNPDSTLGQFAMTTGCFRNGTPIVDPVTRETLGYEMEMVASPFAAFA